jgi:MFS family permease
VGASACFGVACLVAASMPTYWTFAIALIPVGISALTLMTAANATVQITTDPAMRGRVMSLYMAIFMGGTPIGAPFIGWVGETFGARYTILLGGVVSLVVAGVAGLYLVRTNHLQVRYRIMQRPHLLVTSAGIPITGRQRAEREEREAAKQAIAANQAKDSASAA